MGNQEHERSSEARPDWHRGLEFGDGHRRRHDDQLWTDVGISQGSPDDATEVSTLISRFGELGAFIIIISPRIDGMEPP